MKNISLRKWKTANATIEASIIIPMIVTILLIFIYLFFFSYNKIVLTQGAYCSALRASQMEYSTANEQKRKAENTLVELYKNQLIALNIYSKKITVSQKVTSVSTEIKQSIPFEKLVGPFTKTGSLSFCVTKSAKQSNPYDFIRIFRKGAKK